MSRPAEAGEKEFIAMKRVLLKLSGEALAGPKKTGFDEDDSDDLPFN